MKRFRKPRFKSQDVLIDLPETAARGTPDPEPFFDITDKWLTTEEAAEYLRISPKCLLNEASNGKIPHYKFGRRNRYLFSELKKLLLGKPRGSMHGN